MIARHVKLKMNRKLKKQLDVHLWHLTGVYNWAIKTIELRKNLGLSYLEFDMFNLVSGHCKKIGISSVAIQSMVHEAFGTWQRCWSKQNRKPHLKGKRNQLNTILFRSGCKLYPETNQLRLPKSGKVKFHGLTTGFPTGKLASAVRLIKKSSGWYAVLLFDTDHKQITLASNSKIGIDTGFKSLITTSEGQKFTNPKELEKSLNQLAKNQRGKSKKKTARLQEKIANQRKDRNHKISHDLVKNHQEIYITNDKLKGQAKLFGKQIASSGIEQLRQFILYKGSSCGRVVKLVESRYSTMRCSGCEALTGPTGLNNLNIRDWVCEACGAEHDRDVNAAINTLNAGLRYSLEAAKAAVLEPVRVTEQLKKSGNYAKSCPGRVTI